MHHFKLLTLNALFLYGVLAQLTACPDSWEEGVGNYGLDVIQYLLSWLRGLPKQRLGTILLRLQLSQLRNSNLLPIL